MPPGFIVSSMISAPAKLMVVTPPAQLIGSGGVKRLVAPARQPVAARFARNRRFRTADSRHM